jgi:hypothetical protein
MAWRGKAQITTVVAAAALVGHLLGSPAIAASPNLVTVKDPKTRAKARVIRGRLWVDTRGSTVTVTDANGESPDVQGERLLVDIGNPTLQVEPPEAQTVIAFGSGTTASDVGGSEGILTGVSTQNSGAGINITVRADVDCDGTAGNAEWLYSSGTADVAVLPEGGISYCGPLDVLRDTGGAWVLYGMKSG